MSRRTLAAAVVVAVLALALAAPAAALKKPIDAEELFNPLLGVDYSHWLVGPIYQMASEQEVGQFLRLTSDEEAASFIEAFWKRQNEGAELFKKTPQQIFEQRAEKADSRYSRGTFPGRLTDRGTIYVLFGEPEDTVFESSEYLDGVPVETWEYGKDSGKGLTGEKPKKKYRFLQLENETVFYNNRASEMEAKKRQRKRIRF
ncbi:MAG: GWxTD domain-containing protein [bacterium]|nr:GWxTD domain-containing protein [bacterium]